MKQGCMPLYPRDCRLHKQRCCGGGRISRPHSESDLYLSWWIKRNSSDSFKLFREHPARQDGDAESFTHHRENGGALTGLIANGGSLLPALLLEDLWNFTSRPWQNQAFF